jgi:hypothetical protein
LPIADDKCIGHLKIAFLQAFYYLKALAIGKVKKEEVFSRAMRDVIKAGGDTDTNAAIVGGLIGAAVGLHSNIERSMVEKMLGARSDLPKNGRLRPGELVPAIYLPQLLNRVFSEAPT